MELVKKITDIFLVEAPKALQDFSWIRLEGEIKAWPDGYCDLGIVYFDESNQRKIPYYSGNDGMQYVHKIDSIGELRKLLSEYYNQCINVEKMQWNRGVIYLFSDFKIELSFWKDDELWRNYQIKLVETCIEAIAEEFYRDIYKISKEISLTDLMNITAKVSIRQNKVKLVYYVNRTLEIEIKISDTLSDSLLDNYKIINYGGLKGYFPVWNTVLYQLPIQEQEFVINKHVSYEMN